MSTPKNAESWADYSGVCARIKRCAAEQGLSNSDLARKAEVSERLVYKVLNGSANLRPSTIGKFARALGVQFECLITGASPPVVREDRVRYGVAASRDGMPSLETCIRAMASQLGVPEERVRDAIAELIRRNGHG